MVDTDPSAPEATSPPAVDRPLWALRCAAALLMVAIVGLIAALGYQTREVAISNGENHLADTSLTLAEHVDRSFRSLDLLLANIADHINIRGVDSDEALAKEMGDYATYLLLTEKLSALPEVDAVTIIDAHGRLINFSRYWPIPEVNVADRDYFEALSSDASLTTFISTPVQNRGNGTWTFYLAHRFNRADGQFGGLVLGAVLVNSIEDFFRSVNSSPGSATSLLRIDGTLLARYPHSKEIGTSYPNGGPRALSYTRGIIRDASPIDGTMRVKAAHALPSYPLLVLATATETSILGDWWTNLAVLVAIGLAAIGSVLLAAMLIARWWRQQRDLAAAEAGKVNAERARAIAEAELMRERERAADATSRAKSNFLAVMSHEIRTPMNAVLGLASTLLDTDLDPDQRRAVGAIQESGDSLLHVLNDILDLSKIEAGKIDLEPLPFSPEAHARTVLAVVALRAAAKHVALRTEIAPALPPFVTGDAGRIRQILLNLVTNAVKFTERGEVVLSLRCIAEDEASATLEWSVRDTGMGIAPQRIGTLFGEFVQADSSITRRFGGTGLGLAISKRLVAEMKGEIEVDSTLGKGSTFRFRLILPKAANAGPGKQSGAAIMQDLKTRLDALGRPLRILIAEDDATNQFVVSSMLKDLAIETTVVENGVAALEAAARDNFDMAFMDVRMPEMSGIEATRHLRARGGALVRLPILGFTANAFPEDIKECLAAGMQQVVAKPVRKATFLAAIVSVLKARDEGALSSAPERTPNAA